MTTKLLPIIRAVALSRLSEMVPMLERGNLGRNGKISEFIVQLYRMVGICGLLHDCSIYEFQSNLQKSGAAYAFTLPKMDESSLATSKSHGFFASVACGDEETARTIAQASRKTWNSELEHEDDFLYTRFLMALFYLDASESDLRVITDRLEEVTEGELSPLRDICLAMLGKDTEKFDKGIEDFILDRKEFYAAVWDADDILEEEWATDGQVFVEGIALIKLARKLSLDTQSEYLYIPSLALNCTAHDISPNSWRTVGI